MLRTKRKSLLINSLGLFFFWALSLPILSAQTAPPVPPEYQDLNSSMTGSINSFNQQTLATWDGSKYPVAFSGHLLTLNSGNGPTILLPGAYQSFLLELYGLKAMGMTGVVINMDYPTLDSSFDAWGGQSAAYLDLYQRAFADIRTAGLKIIVETGGTFTNSMFCSVNALPFYQSLSTQEYMNGRAQQALIIAQQLQPDYLNVVQEPDTEADQTQKPEMGTYSGSMQLLNTILGVLRPANVTIPIGAGVGTWLSTDSEGKGAIDYMNGYASTSVDSLDVHVYPVNKDYLPRLNAIASIAQTAGKKLTMTEAWSYKVRDSELGVLTMDTIYSRDVFSFWAPTDAQFLQAMFNFAHAQHLDFMATFWSSYFRGNLEWNDSTSVSSPVDLFAQIQAVQGQQRVAGGFTSLAQVWEDLLVNPTDTAPPDQMALNTANVYPNQVVLSWPRPNDNVGVAAFIVERDGVVLATTGNTGYSDKNLTDGKEYSYKVTAFDLKGNQTSSTLSVTTPDNTRPTPPTEATAEGDSNTSIRLSWSGDTDNVKVTGYKIYRGVSGATPTGIAAVDASPFLDSGLQSNTTYCYYVLSSDKAGFASDPSPTSCFTTPDTRAPSVPTNFSATGIEAPQISLSWSASTDGVGVAGYNIQRRSYDGTYAPLANGVTAASYVDATATQLADTAAPVTAINAPVAGATVKGTVTFSAGATDVGTPTMYCYQVNSFDAAGNTSVWSAVSTVTWPTNTSGIASILFVVDGQQVAESTVSPYYVGWDTTAFSNGDHILTVVARDKAGNLTTSAPVVVTVGNFDTIAPTVPKSVSATGATAPQATVAWAASTDAKGVVGYNIQRKLNSSAWMPLASGVTSTSYLDGNAAQVPDTTAPTTTVYAPTSGATVKGSVTFSATATDSGNSTTYSYQVNAFDGAGNVSAWSAGSALTWPVNTSGIAGVRFQVDGIDQAEVTTAPYYITWNTTLFSNGPHTLTVVTRDKADNSGTSVPVVVTVGNFDTTAPTVPGSLVASGVSPQPITVSWGASTDGTGVAGYNVQRRLAGGVYAPIASGLATPGFVDGNVVLQPDIAPPTASIAAPTAGAAVSGIITFSASAYDTGTKTNYQYQVNAYDAAGNASAWSYPVNVNWGTNTSGVAGVRFLVDGVDVGTEVVAAPYYVRWNTTTVTNGSHTLSIVARDNAGAATTSAIVITVLN
jgi:fibronectin type 3 domain-containing protein